MHTHSTTKLKVYRIRYCVIGVSPPPLDIIASYNQSSILMSPSCWEKHQVTELRLWPTGIPAPTQWSLPRGHCVAHGKLK